RGTLPAGQTRDVFFAYDNFGAMTEARFDSATSAYGVFFSYDALGRLTQEQNTVSGRTWNIGYQYDAAGRRSRLTYPDGAFVTYGYDTLSRPTGVWRQGTDAVRTWTYNAKGQVSAIGPGFDTQFVYEDSGRLFQQSDYGSDSSAWSYNRYSYNPAGQVEQEQFWYDNAIWDKHEPETVGYTVNGLNQYTVVDGKNFTYDANGNLTADGTDTFTYDPANRLIGVPSKGATLAYDPLGRLHSVTDASGTERFLYDGNALIMEFNASGGILARHVHGLNAGDDPIASYTGSLFAASNEQLIRQDRLGSVMLMSTDRTTATVNVNTYDEYGVPGSGNTGRFQYTGQVWLPQIGLYHYKARTYSPTLGRFLQSDPIGYGDGLNMYAYVKNDPLNGIDPYGLWKLRCQKFTITITTPEGTVSSSGTSCVWIPEQKDFATANFVLNQLDRIERRGFSCPTVKTGDPGSLGDRGNAVRNLGTWEEARDLANAAESATIARFGYQANNDPTGAYRHFYWNFSMAQRFGAEVAKQFGDAHEVQGAEGAGYDASNSPAETQMDLYNNAAGIAFATDPQTRNLPPQIAAEIALKAGCLQEKE
ncbi:MAG: hypothetical protein COW16_03855, partial [Sphingomonadales bacterium CG12_big_fil_rev_8_21_14_0_65_65_10]